jgi:hypothetical protein
VRLIDWFYRWNIASVILKNILRIGAICNSRLSGAFKADIPGSYISKFDTNRLRFGRRYSQIDGYIVSVFRIENFQIAAGYDVHDSGGVVVGECDFHTLHDRNGNDASVRNNRPGGFRICANESPRPQLLSPEVPYHDQQYIRQTVDLEHRQNRPTGSPGGFTVVGKPGDPSVTSQPVGITMVRRIVIPLPILPEMAGGLFGRRDPESRADKP